MKLLRFITIALLVVPSLAGGGKEPVSISPGSINWLLNNWQGTFDGSNISETWKQVNDELYIGQGFVYGGFGSADTFVREDLRIQKIANYWAFIPVINEQPPVLFTLVSHENNTLIFENKEHDFPQRVCYAYEDGKLHAWIEGQKGKKTVKEDYWYEKQ